MKKLIKQPKNKESVQYQTSIRFIMMQASSFLLAVIFLTALESITCTCTGGGNGHCIVRDPATIGSPKKVITGIRGPHNVLITPSNDVFIPGYFDKFLYRYDIQGNFKKKYKVPSGNPMMLDLHDGELYVTNLMGNTVYTAKFCNGELGPFRPFIFQSKPTGFKISKDGSRTYVSEYHSGRIHMYNCALNKIGTFLLPKPSFDPTEIQFDLDGNINVPSYNPKIHVYSKTGVLIRTITHPGAKAIQGFFNNCDGTRVLADRSGKVVFAHADGSTIKVISGYGMKQPADVTIAPDGTLWVADVIGNKVFLF